MDFPLRCACGSVQGHVEVSRLAGRARCYCKDCQSFARFLGAPEKTLDAHGGTDIVATSPRHVHITCGVEQLRCMSLSPKGTLRWYAACCRTPIGNTPRDPRISFVGLIHDSLAGTPAELDDAFGPARAAVNTGSATGRVEASAFARPWAVARVATHVLWSRISGKYRDNPFFRAGTSEPMVAPEVLTRAQRSALRGDA